MKWPITCAAGTVGANRFIFTCGKNKKRGISAFFAKFWGISAILLKVLGAFQQISFEKRGIFAYSPFTDIPKRYIRRPIMYIPRF